MINVVVADDHDLVRHGIASMLNGVTGIKVIGEVSDGEQAVKMVRDAHPQVVLMDINMPGGGGLEATRKLMRIDPDIKVLVITASDNHDVLPSLMLQAGAAGYLTKGASGDELIRAIRAVYAGQRYISPNIAKQLALKHVGEIGQSPFELLSERELQVTMLIIQGFRPQEISEKLFLSPKTVNSYRYRIFEKLKAKNDVELTLLAIQYGLIDTNDIPQGEKSSAVSEEDIDSDA